MQFAMRKFLFLRDSLTFFWIEFNEKLPEVKRFVKLTEFSYFLL